MPATYTFDVLCSLDGAATAAPFPRPPARSPASELRPGSVVPCVNVPVTESRASLTESGTLLAEETGTFPDR